MKVVQITPVEAPLLIFGGAYSNLAATKAIRAIAEDRQIPPGNCINTGDIIAYCAHPVETAQLIRDWGINNVMGNVEESLAQDSDDCGCGFSENTQCAVLSEQWYDYTNQRIDQYARRWMRELPHAIEFKYHNKLFRVIHGGTRQINQFIFPSTSKQEKLDQFEDINADVIIGGHSGIPFGEQIEDKCWLNSGAIGMPANDGTQGGWYLFIESKNSQLQASWHRLGYDAETENQAMKQVGMNSAYADALLSGIWPSDDVLPDDENGRQGIPIELSAVTL